MKRIGGALMGAALLLAAGGAAGQGLPPAPAEMAALAWLVGEWEGEGWIDEGGRRGTFRGTEVVESRMGGRLVVVEGSFTAFMGPELGHVPVHQALGVFSWDERAGEHVFRTYTARGGNGARNAVEVSEGRVVWGYEDPRMGTVRYTLERLEDGRWKETGVASGDGGASWRPFFEMVLTRR